MKIHIKSKTVFLKFMIMKLLLHDLFLSNYLSNLKLELTDGLHSIFRNSNIKSRHFILDRPKIEKVKIFRWPKSPINLKIGSPYNHSWCRYFNLCDSLFNKSSLLNQQHSRRQIQRHYLFKILPSTNVIPPSDSFFLFINLKNAFLIYLLETRSTKVLRTSSIGP